MLLPRAGAGMCARRRSNLSLASPRTSHQREGDPAVRVPFAALRGNLRCALQAGSAQTRLAAQTARGPDPPEAVLLGTARGEGEPGSPSGHRCARPRPPHRTRAGSGAGFSAAQALGAQCNCRITISRSETRAQTPIPERRAQRGFFANLCFRQCITVEMTSGCCRP